MKYVTRQPQKEDQAAKVQHLFIYLVTFEYICLIPPSINCSECQLLMVIKYYLKIALSYISIY